MLATGKKKKKIIVWNEVDKCIQPAPIASFPGRSRLQLWSLAVCTNGGGRKESHAWHQVDMRPLRVGKCPTIVTHKPCVDQPWIHQTVSCVDVVFERHSLNRYYMKILCQAPPPHVYPHIYLTSCMWLFLLGLPLPFCIVIKNWRWGGGGGGKWPWNEATAPMWQSQVLGVSKSWIF